MNNSTMYIILATMFLTRIPLPKVLINKVNHLSSDDYPQAQANSFLYYPLVGFLLGASLVVVAWFLSTPSIAAIIAVALLALITGGLHLDGVADCFDALGAGHSKQNGSSEQRETVLRVLKEPTIGTFGTVAIVLLLLAKYAAITHLFTTSNFNFIIGAIVLARLTPLLYFISTPYVRSGGIADNVAQHLNWQKVIISVALSIIVLSTFIPIYYLIISLVTVTIVLLIWRQLWLNTIQGLTGDCAGALIEIAETILLLLLCIA